MQLETFWKTFNIMDAVENTAKSWSEINSSTWKCAWKGLCPDCVRIHVLRKQKVCIKLGKTSMMISSNDGFQEVNEEEHSIEKIYVKRS